MRFRNVSRPSVPALALLLALCASAAAQPMPERTLIAREGKGYLERVGTQLVLHLKGTPEEMGRQHGALLKDDIAALLGKLEKHQMVQMGPMADFANASFDGVWKTQLPHIPERHVRELNALAEAAGQPFEKLRRANTVPEFFHCSGFAVFGKATRDGRLLHGRVLDYGVSMGLQDHNVVIIAEPDGFIPFVTVGYAGFVGSVTGMNLKGIGFGEMGGSRPGKWDGTPMAILMRRGLEEADSLESAVSLFRNARRTCEFYYVISDASIPSAVAMRATPESLEILRPGESHPLLDYPMEDAVLLSEGERYRLLAQRVRERHGKIGPQEAIELMRRPVAMEQNLHNVLMSPGTGEMWVAHADSDGSPASERTYTYLDIQELMSRMPDSR